MIIRTNKSSKESHFSDGAKATCCILFLAISIGFWLSLETTWAKTLYYVIFLLPTYACGEWLSSKLFSAQRGLNISQSGFSAARIFFSVLTVIALFGIVYGLALLGRWILFS